METLEALAGDCPFEKGPAVFYARNLIKKLQPKTGIILNVCEKVQMENQNRSLYNFPYAYEYDPTEANDMDNLNGMPAEMTTFEIEMYPNPSKDLVTLQANTALMQIEVINTLGQLVLSEQVNATNKVDINIAALPAGLYLVKVKSATEVTVKHLRKID